VISGGMTLNVACIYMFDVSFTLLMQELQ